jgi:hypothetical protein
VGLGRESSAAATGEYNTAKAEKTRNTIRLTGRNFRNMNDLLGIPELYTTSIFEFAPTCIGLEYLVACFFIPTL